MGQSLSIWFYQFLPVENMYLWSDSSDFIQSRTLGWRYIAFEVQQCHQRLMIHIPQRMWICLLFVVLCNWHKCVQCWTGYFSPQLNHRIMFKWLSCFVIYLPSVFKKIILMFDQFYPPHYLLTPVTSQYTKFHFLSNMILSLSLFYFIHREVCISVANPFAFLSVSSTQVTHPWSLG